MVLFQKTDKLFFQLFRYGISGGIAFIVDFCLLFILKEYANINYLIAGAIGFIAGLIITYFFSIHWIFDKRKIDNIKIEFSLFVLIGVVGILLNIGVLWLFTSIFCLHYLISKIISTMIVSLWNFFAKKIIIF